MIKSALAAIFTLFRLSFAEALELQNGDVLLISFNCNECRVIESETNSSFSHSGIVIKNEAHQIRIGQSLGHVALYPMDQFLKNKTPGSTVSVYRPKEFLELKSHNNDLLEQDMLSYFNSVFKDAPFDSKYLWNNFDEKGRERLYCSEFVAKFIDHFLETSTVLFPLTYKKNEAFWFQYFQGMIPEGELGNSPSSFSHDDRFVFVGIL